MHIGLWKPLISARSRIEVLEQQVAHGPVRVVDEDLGGAGVEGTEDRRVGVAGHEHPPPRIVGSVR